MKAIITAMVFAVLVGSIMVSADEKAKVWCCKDRYVPNACVVVLVQSEELGLIRVHDIEQTTVFGVDGVLLRWDFGLNAEDEYERSFFIWPDGTGAYVDFSTSEGETAKAAQTYNCEVQDWSQHFAPIKP